MQAAFIGDHGESLTEHDIYWDHCGLYKTTVQVPHEMTETYSGRTQSQRVRTAGGYDANDIKSSWHKPPPSLDGQSL